MEARAILPQEATIEKRNARMVLHTCRRSAYSTTWAWLRLGPGSVLRRINPPEKMRRRRGGGGQKRLLWYSLPAAINKNEDAFLPLAVFSIHVRITCAVKDRESTVVAGREYLGWLVVVVDVDQVVSRSQGRIGGL